MQQNTVMTTKSKAESNERRWEKNKKHKFKGLVANSDRLMSGTEGLESPNTIWQT